MSGINAAAVTVLANTFAVARGGTIGNTNEKNVAQAIADLVLKADVTTEVTGSAGGDPIADGEGLGGLT